MAKRVLILSDGRPGHFNLSEGIAAAVCRRMPAEVSRLTLRRRWPGHVVAAAVNLGLPPAFVLRRFYHLDPGSVPDADLIISAGAETLGASVALARLTGAPNIFYGSLRSFRPTDFALVLTSYARNAARPNHAVALKPSQFDPASLPPVASISQTAPPAVVALLIGGDAPGVRFEREDWTSLLQALSALHRAYGTRAIVSNSRRTPEDVSDRLRDLAQDTTGPIKRFVDIRLPGAPRLPVLLAEAAAVLVTADSSSMLSEACWARRPTLSLAPQRMRLTTDEAGYRSWLAAQGWCSEVPLAEASADHLLVAWSRLKPMSDNPIDHLAALLAQRLPRFMQS